MAYFEYFNRFQSYEGEEPEKGINEEELHKPIPN
jgi:hypothetical protein